MSLTVSLLESSEYHEVHGASLVAAENGDVEFTVPHGVPYSTTQVQLAAGSGATATSRAYLTEQSTDHGTTEGIPAVSGAVGAVSATYTTKRMRRLKWTVASNNAACRIYFVCHRV